MSTAMWLCVCVCVCTQVWFAVSTREFRKPGEEDRWPRHLSPPLQPTRTNNISSFLFPSLLPRFAFVSSSHSLILPLPSPSPPPPVRLSRCLSLLPCRGAHENMQANVLLDRISFGTHPRMQRSKWNACMLPLILSY